MRKVAIIGVGHVGSTTAYTLISKNIVDELVLFDSKENILKAELNDLMDGQMEQDHQVRLIEPNLTELADTDVIIFSAGDISIFEGNPDRFAELNLTKTIVKEWAPKIKESGFKGIILNITNPCDVITQYLQELTGFPRERVFGTGTSLDTGRMKHAVSQKMLVNPSAIDGYVVGEHGESQFVAWSSVRIGGVPITDTLTVEKLDALDMAARDGGWVTFRGKGYTSYGIAIQAARIVEAILNNNYLVVPVSHFHSAEDCYVGSPAKVSQQGISESFPLNLSNDEQKKWQHTIQTIHSMHATI
ncbi:L-lactate dehydrogenase [Enterococcus avium]|uniref:lactate/malate family dehydrogenase n=1 Tax=Enterococcus malodoratus TaxID=71451 RepID=UPI0008D08BA2|nr:L-lactate dehydrogenase [Enterococcus malodoratus]BBM18919.1 L-lactate dehydrogenase [Enterococcus avium]SET97293.1 L-lactate dehydrogenase [Enterococcus malodoratus]